MGEKKKILGIIEWMEGKLTKKFDGGEEEAKLLKKARAFISMTLVLGLTLSLLGTVWAADSAADDLKGHWAEKQMKVWVASGLLKGYDDGSIQPNRAVTRAEFMTLVNRAFNLQERASISFTDLKADHWAYGQIAAAVHAGYVKGYEDGTVGWSKQVSREESAVMAALLLKLELPAEPDLNAIADGASVSAWGKASVAALIEAGVMKGDKTGRFVPKGKLTRAEAVTLLDSALAYTRQATTFSEAGTYGPESGVETIQGNVVIASAGVTLRNVVIEGDLTVAKSVGEGDVFFKKVEVKGNTFIQGGGANSVHFEDSVLVRITVDKRDGSVRVVVAGATSVQQVIVGSPVKLEESNVTDSGFQNVELSKAMPAGAEVQLLGTFENVQVLSSDIKVSIPSGTIKSLQVGAGAGSNQIDISKEAAIVKLVLDAAASLVGQGKVENATVNKGAEGSSFETKPNKTEGTGATSPTPAPVVVPPVSGGGGGGVVPNPTPAATPTPAVTPSPSPTASPCSGERCAQLTSLQLEGYELIQLDADRRYELGNGFNKDVYAYRVLTDRDMQDQTVKLTIQKPANAIINYSIRQKYNRFYSSVPYGIAEYTIEVPLQGLKDTQIQITVDSADHLSSKTYEIGIEYPRTLQEGLMLKNTLSLDGISNDNLPYYQLVIGSLNGARARSGDTIEIYASQEATTPIKACKVSGNNFTDCLFTKAQLSSGEGSFFVKITREGNVLAQGEYVYDLSSASLLAGGQGVAAIPADKESLKKLALDMMVAVGFSHGYSVHLDAKELSNSIPDLKYVSYRVLEMTDKQNVLPSAPTVESLKLDLVPFWEVIPPSERPVDIGGYPSGLREIGGSYYHKSSNSQARPVNDMFIVFSFYDKEQNVLGYYTIPLTFDADHVADGYTPAYNWQPGPGIPVLPVQPAQPDPEPIVIEIGSSTTEETVTVKESSTQVVYVPEAP